MGVQPAWIVQKPENTLMVTVWMDTGKSTLLVLVKLSSLIYPYMVSNPGKISIAYFFLKRPTFFKVEWDNVWYNG